MSRSTKPHAGVFHARFNEALAGTTSEAFARRIDVSLRTVTRWRAGDGVPTAATLLVVADALDREPSWFFTDPNESP